MTDNRVMRRLCALLAIAAGVLASTAAADPGLHGAGSSLVFPLVQKWTAGYHAVSGVDISYDAIGSGGGIAEISARTVDFGASDAPLTSDQFALAHGVVQIPWALSATSIPYNLPGLDGRLRLDGPTLAAIYLGRITKWNDPRIKALNPTLTLPPLTITPIYRSDASGTTYNFTDFLSRTSAAWKQAVGKGTAVEFPRGQAAAHSDGVASLLGQTPGGITYVEVAYSLQHHYVFASIKNQAGAFTLPGLRSIMAAARTITSVPASNELHIVYPPAAERLAYPIATFSYVLLPLATPNAVALRKFVFWALTAGQKLGAPLLFAPIPKTVLVAAEKTLDRVHS